VIWTDGLIIYANNTERGFVEYSGTDASNVINNVLSALTKGGKILIKEGTYQISSSISIKKDNVSLYGSGESTKLSLQSVNFGILLQGSDDYWVKHTLLSDFSIDCTDIAGGMAIRGDYVDDIEVRNLRILNLSKSDMRDRAISLRHAKNFRIMENNIDGGFYPIHIGGGDETSEFFVENGTIAFNEIRNCVDGMMVQISRNVKIIENKVTNYLDTGIDSNSNENLTVESNLMENGNGAGICISTNQFAVSPKTYNVSVVGNVIRNCRDGISLGFRNASRPVYNITCSNNTVYGTTNASGYGIRALHLHGGKITSNMINEAGGNGILVHSSDDIVLHRNKIQTSQRAGIYIYNSSKISIRENNIENNGLSGEWDNITIDGGADVEIHYNNIIFGNGTRFLIYNVTPENIIHAENNWWGTEKREEIAARIPEGRNIIWVPFLTEPYKP
jgi:parallel beta-helix repeat protein